MSRDADAIQLWNGSLILTDPHAVLELNILPYQHSHYDMFESNLPTLMGLEVYSEALSVSARALFAPKPEVLDSIRRTWIELTRNDTSYAFVHIRRGDKNKEVPYVPIEKYLERIEAVNFRKKYRATAIFLMCDGDQACEEFRNSSSSLGARYILITYKALLEQWGMTTNTERAEGNSQDKFDRLPESDRLAQATELIVSAYIGALSSFVVCTYSSNFCRLVALLKGGKIVSNDIHSLDWTEFLFVHPPKFSIFQNLDNLYRALW